MDHETEIFISTLCLACGALYTAFQGLRLAFPVWAWNFEGIITKARELLARLDTPPSSAEIRNQIPAEGAIARLLHGKNLDEFELRHRKEFRQSLALLLVSVLFSGAINYGFAESGPHAATYAHVLVVVAIGMVMGKCASYRIYMTIRHIASLVEIQEKAKEEEAAQRRAMHRRKK